MRMECRNCKKPEVDYRKGLWSPDEDEKLRDYILKHGVSCWSAIAAKAGLQRNGKSCRLRWINYLRPGLKRGNFSPEEEELILKLQSKIGNKWSQIAMHLPGRTDNEVKNYWNSYLKKKITKAQDSGTPTTATSALNLTIQRLSKSEQSDHFISSAGSTEALESCQSSLESVIHSTGVGFPKGITSDHLPKVSFADWLPFDHANWGSLFSLEDVISNQWHCKNSYTEEIYRPRSSQVDAQFSNDIVSNSFKFTNTCGEFK